MTIMNKVRDLENLDILGFYAFLACGRQGVDPGGVHPKLIFFRILSRSHSRIKQKDRTTG